MHSCHCKFDRASTICSSRSRNDPTNNKLPR
nr:MAG TPA: hypothetical protein [Caudoviricetes sp.]